MKESEMLKIAELIDRVLTNTNDDLIIAQVKKEVNELSLNFPLYP
jgi:glycine/serine hydroxymethyltransferase